ncbi:MAG: alpha/beta fold hydrolase [Bryobacterales bacterium]|nr:alpha/beta fold hydrolase [Bryobacterales bacterium]
MLALAATLSAQSKVERIKVHGQSLEGNLEGDSPDRDVSIYLPAAYQSDPARRFPVLYMLHGFTDDDARWFGFRKNWINLHAVLDQALAAGSREMIVVMPNAFTVYQGSMYSRSITTGDWETFVSRELVAFLDSHYRTLPSRASRGLAGHSMGGYGALRLAMKHPEVFSAVYLISPCCLAPPSGGKPMPAAEAIKTPAEVVSADFLTKAMIASAAAWSPNPKNPPLFLDLPYKGGEVRPEIFAKWAANAPLSMIDQYIPNLKQLTAIAFDAGRDDSGIAATIRTLDSILSDYAINHVYEAYDGNHVNRVAERIVSKVMPFFSHHLSFPTLSH